MMPPLNFMSMYFGCIFTDYKIRFYKKNAARPMHKQFAEIIRNNFRAV